MAETRDRWFACATLLLGIAVYLMTSLADWAENPFAIGIGPGYWPKLLAGGLIVLSVVQLGVSFLPLTKTADRANPPTGCESAAGGSLAPQRTEETSGETPPWKLAMIVAVVMAVYPLTATLGYYIGATLAVATLMVVMGLRQLGKIAVPLLLTMALSYLLFDVIMKVSLPKGNLF